jgi:hypothetical protein
MTIEEIHQAAYDAAEIGDLVYQETTVNHGGVPQFIIDSYIQLAQGRKVTHVGMVVFFQDGKYVIEAPGNGHLLGPDGLPIIINGAPIPIVGATPLKEWLARGKDGEFVFERVPNLCLFDKLLLQFTAVQFIGKPYDFSYNYHDDWNLWDVAAKSYVSSNDIWGIVLSGNDNIFEEPHPFFAGLTMPTYCTTFMQYCYKSIGIELYEPELFADIQGRAPIWEAVFFPAGLPLNDTCITPIQAIDSTVASPNQLFDPNSKF